MIKFWNFKTVVNKSETDQENETTENLLFINGEIASESWLGDEVTPKMFKEELNAVKGDLTVWINSPGGDVVAGSMIYTMLKEYNGNVEVKIDGMAASAASVIAMAGDRVCMSPTAMMMVHNVSSWAFGNKHELAQAIKVLKEFEESIINAYELKTGLERNEIQKMMDAETWMNAQKAVELGFADEMLYAEPKNTLNSISGYSYSAAGCIKKLSAKLLEQNAKPPEPTGEKIEHLEKRLNLFRR